MPRKPTALTPDEVFEYDDTSREGTEADAYALSVNVERLSEAFRQSLEQFDADKEPE